MGNFKCCPECGSEQITDEKHGGSYLIVCRECGFAVGPYALLWRAIEKWNGLKRSAVIPEPVKEETQRAPGLLMIPIEHLHNHPKNVRKRYDDIDALADSIKKHGVMQNLTVVPDPDSEDDYFVVIGNRRLQAAQLAGLSEVPCSIAWEMTEAEQQTVMLTENMQRKDLTALEESDGMQLCLDLGLTENDLKEKTGLSKTTIRHRLKMQELEREGVEKACESGATIFDFIKLEKIKDLELRNEVLQYIGTKNFDFELNRAIERERKAKAMEQMQKKLDAAAVQVEDVDLKTYEFETSWYAGFDNALKIPETAAPGEYVYKKANDELIYLYKRKADADTDNDIMDTERAKQKAYVEDQQRWQAERDELGKTLKACRMDFMRSTTARKPMKMELFKYVGMSMIRYELSGNNGERFYHMLYKPALIELYGLKDGNEATYSFIAQKLAKQPQRTLEDLLYLGLESYSDLPTVTHERKWMHDAKFAFMYEVLKAMGYKMSDDEIQLLDGTHKIYEGDHKT